MLLGYRLQVFERAARASVSEPCRTFGIHRSTYYRWKRAVDRHGLEILRPRERRRPAMPNALAKMVEERIVAFSIAHPGLGPRRVASELGREKWGAIGVSHSGVWRCLVRHGLSPRPKRYALVAGHRAAHEPPREPEPERHIDAARAPSAVARRSRLAPSFPPRRHPGRVSYGQSRTECSVSSGATWEADQGLDSPSRRQLLSHREPAARTEIAASRLSGGLGRKRRPPSGR